MDAVSSLFLPCPLSPASVSGHLKCHPLLLLDCRLYSPPEAEFLLFHLLMAFVKLLLFDVDEGFDLLLGFLRSSYFFRGRGSPFLAAFLGVTQRLLLASWVPPCSPF